MIAGLRGLGIPAGYVSGFLRTIPPPGKERLEGADAMHAWVRVWCGREAGWQEFDPTNGMRAGDDHITVGYGRDYSDVAPIVGVVKIAGGQAAEQSVDVIPLGGVRRQGLLRRPLAPQPDRQRAGAPADLRLDPPGQHAFLVQRAVGAGDLEHIVADGELGAVAGGDFHQPACHIDGVAGGGDLLVLAAEPRRHDGAEMRAELEADPRPDRCRLARPATPSCGG